MHFPGAEEKMEQPGSSHRRTWLARCAANIPLLLGVSVVGAIMGIAWYVSNRTDHRQVEFLKCEPVQSPPAVEAGSSWLPDNAPVIGVMAAGRYRAYALRTFDYIDQHVVNDLLGNTPITVAYCNRTGCARVYTDPIGNRPLAVAVGGWVGEPGIGPDGVMLLRYESSYYYQDTGRSYSGPADFPFPPSDFEQMTWGEWRRAHPDTDVISGPEPGH